MGSPKLNYFGEAHAKTAKEPDAAVFSMEYSEWPLLVVESGFSESYARIMQDITHWLDYAPVKLAIAFIVNKGPKASLSVDDNFNFTKTPNEQHKFAQKMRDDTYAEEV